MSFTARYAGICKECGGRFEAGSQVESVGAGYAHVDCPEDRKAAVVCTTCWLEKPCPCDDGQAAA